MADDCSLPHPVLYRCAPPFDDRLSFVAPDGEPRTMPATLRPSTAGVWRTWAGSVVHPRRTRGRMDHGAGPRRWCSHQLLAAAGLHARLNGCPGLIWAPPLSHARPVGAIHLSEVYQVPTRLVVAGRLR